MSAAIPATCAGISARRKCGSTGPSTSAIRELTWFRVGPIGGEVGVDPHLLIGLAEDLECLLNRWKPAHTEIVFDYSGLTNGGSMAGTP